MPVELKEERNRRMNEYMKEYNKREYVRIRRMMYARKYRSKNKKLVKAIDLKHKMKEKLMKEQLFDVLIEQHFGKPLEEMEGFDDTKE